MQTRSSVIIKLSERCNERCAFCFQDNNTRLSKPIRTDKEVFAMLFAIKKAGHTMVQFTGGEPLIHKKSLLLYVQFAKKIGIPFIYVQTNGVYLSDKKTVDELCMAGVNMFHVSFHSIEKGIQDTMVGLDGAYEKTLRGLDLLVAKDSYVGVQIVMTKQNLHTLRDTVEFLLKKGILHFTLRFPTIDGSMKQYMSTLLPTYTEVQGPLRETLRLFSGLKGRYVYLMNIPACIIPEWKKSIVTGIHNYLIELDGKNSHYFEAKKQKNRFSKMCDTCNMKSSCIGIEPEYSEQYGFSECTPLGVSDEIDIAIAPHKNALELYRDGLIHAGKQIFSPQDLQSYILTPEFFQAQEIPVTLLQGGLSPREAVVSDSILLDHRSHI